MSVSRSRRSFLMDSATVAKGSFLALSLPVILSACQRSQQALEQGAGFRVFQADEAADLTAIAARIIPTDDTPGATEAGVIYFLDTIFAEARRASQLALLREGLAALRGQLTTGGAISTSSPKPSRISFCVTMSRRRFLPPCDISP